MAEGKHGIGAHLGGHLRENGMLVALVAIVAFFTVILALQPQPVSFLQPLNINNLFLQNGHVIILALGMLLVIVSGHIDLSVGSVAAFTGACSAWMTVSLGLPFPLVILLTLAIGGAIGAAQGYWVAYWRIPSFIVTLAGMMVFRGATMWMLGGQNIGPFPKGFQSLSSGFIPDLTGIGRPHGLTLLLVAAGIGAIFWLGFRGRARDREFGIEPEPMALFAGRQIAVAAAVGFVGWQLASFRGLPNVLVVLAGMIVTARLNSATPKAGTGFELDAIAAVFIGGASMTGGSGRIVGVVIGALIMGIMNMGMSILGVGIDYQQMIKGLVLLAAVIFDVYNKSK